MSQPQLHTLLARALSTLSEEQQGEVLKSLLPWGARNRLLPRTDRMRSAASERVSLRVLLPPQLHGQLKA